MLDEFLAGRQPSGEEETTWPGNPPLPLRIRYFVTADSPPDDLVTSVRAVVRLGGDVLVLRNPDAVHALPGGRREAGETHLDTLRREVLEESGYAIESARPLGVVHLRHLGPRPPDYAYLYPDFLWVVYAAQLGSSPRTAVHDDYEREARLMPVDDALRVVDYGSRLFIHAAVDELVLSSDGGGTDT